MSIIQKLAKIKLQARCAHASILISNSTSNKA